MNFLASVAIALQTLRTNPIHTLFSTLGIIIGVAALVGILALGDGMERWGREQIATTTDLQSIVVRTQVMERLDGVFVQRTDYPLLSLEDVAILQQELLPETHAVLNHTQTVQLQRPADSTRYGAYLHATMPNIFETRDVTVQAGRLMTETDLTNAAPVMVISQPLATRINGEASVETLLGQSLQVQGSSFEIIGIIEDESQDNALAVIPFSAQPAQAPRRPPLLTVYIENIEMISPNKAQIEAWLTERFGDNTDDFQVVTNEMRVEQIERGVTLFKWVMGLITGLSVLVGGIGVMNVLLVSINERTREIGIRKATGARRRDIIFQFLAESLTISSAGCLLGFLLGITGIFIVTPIVRSITEVPFQAGFSWSTLVVVLITALIVGIVFGTYPAWRAARLTPVDAIRHE